MFNMSSDDVTNVECGGGIIDSDEDANNIDKNSEKKARRNFNW